MKSIHVLIAFSTLLGTVSPVQANPNGEYESWINSEIMMTDHRAYCSDIVAQDTTVNKGSEYQKDIGKEEQDNNGSRQNSSASQYLSSGSSSKANSKKISAGGKGILSRISGGSSSSSEQASTYKNSGSQEANSASTWDKDQRSAWNKSSGSTWEETTVTSKTAGKNCDVLLQTAADRDINHDQQLTNRMAIEAKERVKLEELETQSQMSLFENLMQGW